MTGVLEALTVATINQKKNKNSKILNPSIEQLSFGQVPQNNNHVPSGHIYLRLGDKGVVRGGNIVGAFGARHVWDKHRKDLNLSKPQDIAIRIGSIMTAGVDILIDPTRATSSVRPVVLNTAIGVVALQLKHSASGVPEYSIVSAYGRKTNPGIVIGKLISP